MKKNYCNICGSTYILKNGRFVCHACGAFMPESLEGDESILLSVAYQQLRMGNFDDAFDMFNDIIAKFPNSTNGLWGLLLSKYGIKYEADYDGKSIPTCYATSYESILSDAYYAKVIGIANDEDRKYFESQAQLIENIRKEWVEKASKEKPYDIFLSYKDTEIDNGNEQTPDRNDVYAIYNHLTQLGYRVFFAYESLKDKIGEKYEPYIFNALNTAKVMIVYASKIDYINATWVKNEWSRFYKRIKNKEKIDNSLVVAYKDFNPGLLSNPLKSLQCINAKSLTFVNELDSYVESIVKKSKYISGTQIIRKEIKPINKNINISVTGIKTISINKNKALNQNETPVVETNDLDSKNLIPLTLDENKKNKLALILLEDGSYSSALDRFEDILKEYPDNETAKMGILLSKNKSKNIDNIKNQGFANIKDKEFLLDSLSQLSMPSLRNIMICLIENINVNLVVTNYANVMADIDILERFPVPQMAAFYEKLFSLCNELINNKTYKNLIPVFDRLVNIFRDSKSLFEKKVFLFSESLMTSGLFESTKKYIDILSDGAESSCYHKILLLETRLKNAPLAKALIFVKNADDFKEVENIITDSTGNYIDTFLDHCYVTCANCIISNDSKTSVQWLKILLKYDYENREQMINKCFDVCNQTATIESCDAFDELLLTMNDKNKAQYARITTIYCQSLSKKTLFAKATAYLVKLNDLFPSDERIAFQLLIKDACLAKEENFSYGIAFVQHLEYFDRYFRIFTDKAELTMTIRTFCSYCDKYIERFGNNKITQNVFDVFERLLTYFPKNKDETLVDCLQSFANELHKRGYYEQAIKYYETIISYKSNLSSIYWSLFKAKNSVYDDSEVAELPVSAFDCSEFEDTLANETNDKKVEMYLDFKVNNKNVLKQKVKELKAFRKRNHIPLDKDIVKKRIQICLFCALGICTVCGITGTSVLMVSRQKKRDQGFVFRRNDDGYEVILGKNFILKENEKTLIIPSFYNNKKVNKIADNFYDLSLNVEEVVIPYTVESIGDFAFSEATTIRKYSFTNDKDEIISDYDDTTWSQIGLKEIGNDAFYKNNITSFIADKALTSIGNNAFRETKLESFNFGNSLSKIGDYSFMSTYLTTVNVPDSLHIIPTGAFSDCTNINSVNLNQVSAIGKYAFSCVSLDELHIPSTMSKIDTYSFAEIGKVVFDARTEYNHLYFSLDNIALLTEINIKVIFKLTNGSFDSALNIPTSLQLGVKTDLPVPTWEGHNFKGWCLNTTSLLFANSSGTMTSELTATNNLVLIPSWS